MRKTVVITGASGVLCSEFARSLADEYNLVLISRTEKNLNKLADEINSGGGSAAAVPADVLDKQSLICAYKKTLEIFGSCDILINGAGGNAPSATTGCEYYSNDDSKSFFELDEKAVTDVFGLNVTGALLTTQVFAKDMAGKGGCVINISSMNAYRPLTKIPAYSAAKAALSNFTQWLAVYFAQSGIRVNAIAPGFFATKQNHELLFNKDGSLTERSKKIVNGTPMRRFGEPKELIGTLKWLIDDSLSGFVTGVTIPVDGGFSAYSGV